MIKLEKFANSFKMGGISNEIQEKLTTSKVLVMGSGALGSGLIMNLASLGIGQIKLIDDEIVEEKGFNSELIHKYKNITRAKVLSAKDWIQEYNPDIKVEIAKIKLNEINYFNIIQGYDIIVDCFDSYENKYLLNDIAVRNNKILIHGSLHGFCGQITTIIPNKTGCLSCVIPKPTTLKEEYAIITPVATTISSLQAQEVLKIIGNTGEPLLNKLLIYDACKSEFKILNYMKNITCDSCGENSGFLYAEK